MMFDFGTEDAAASAEVTQGQAGGQTETDDGHKSPNRSEGVPFPQGGVNSRNMLVIRRVKNARGMKMHETLIGNKCFCSLHPAGGKVSALSNFRHGLKRRQSPTRNVRYLVWQRQIIRRPFYPGSRPPRPTRGAPQYCIQ